jgi:hypothetical protein
MEGIQLYLRSIGKLAWVTYMLYAHPETLDRLNNLRRIKCVRRAQEKLDGAQRTTG